MHKTLELLDFKPVRRGSLRGFAAVKLPIGLVINDVTIGESHGKQWALLPNKAMLDRQRNLMRDQDGKVKYAPVVEWSTSELRTAFSVRVAALVTAAHPDAFDPPGPVP
jgi:hypothetical protein